MFDSWDEAVLEAAIEFVEADPHLAEYEAWEEAALAATVDAYHGWAAGVNTRIFKSGCLLCHTSQSQEIVVARHNS
jgi:hypothetical protein